MKTTDAPSRIGGVSVSKVELVSGGAGDMSLKVRANLISGNGDIHGISERVGGWSAKVTQATNDFVEALEAFLLAVHFDTGEEEDGKSAERSTPKGILGA